LAGSGSSRAEAVQKLLLLLLLLLGGGCMVCHHALHGTFVLLHTSEVQLCIFGCKIT
jgi:hypothetical protein